MILKPGTERYLDFYHVEKAFISGKGLHLQKGVSESSESHALIKQKMLSLADEVYRNTHTLNKRKQHPSLLWAYTIAH